MEMASFSLGHPTDVCPGGIGTTEDITRRLKEGFACGIQADTARQALEQDTFQLFFQLLHLPAQRGLDDM